MLLKIVWMTNRGSAAVRAIIPALVAAALCSATFALLDRPLSPALVLAALSGTFLVYILDRTLWAGPEDAGKNTSIRLPELLAGCFSAFVLGATLPLLRTGTIALAAAIGLFALAYAMPILGRRLKDTGRLKPVFVAGGWAAGAVLLPAFEAQTFEWMPIGVLLVYRLAYLLPNTIAADIADARADARAGLAKVFSSPARDYLINAGSVACAIALALAGIALLSGYAGGLMLVDSAGVLFILAMLHVNLGAAQRAFVLDVAMLWPAVTWWLSTL